MHCEPNDGNYTGQIENQNGGFIGSFISGIVSFVSSIWPFGHATPSSGHDTNHNAASESNEGNYAGQTENQNSGGLGNFFSNIFNYIWPFGHTAPYSDSNTSCGTVCAPHCSIVCNNHSGGQNDDQFDNDWPFGDNNDPFGNNNDPFSSNTGSSVNTDNTSSTEQKNQN